ncbi:hypothetical protein HDU98_011055 [Podochytrium sp. JEL0797]|nr:hypothetical protein HDU98_011055 [Podochytrium sp. JEL0797]
MKQNDVAQRLSSLETAYHHLEHTLEQKNAQLKEEMDEKVDALTSLATLLRIEMQRLNQSVSQLWQERGQNEVPNMSGSEWYKLERGEWQEKSQGGERIKGQSAAQESTAPVAGVLVSTSVRDLQVETPENVGNLLQENRTAEVKAVDPNATQSSMLAGPKPSPEPIPKSRLAASEGILLKSTELALSAAKYVIPSPTHSMMLHASSMVLGESVKSKLQESGKMEKEHSPKRRISAMGNWLPATDGILLKSTELALFTAKCMMPSPIHSMLERASCLVLGESKPDVPTNSTITQLPIIILVRILVYTVKPIQSNVGLHLMNWHDQRVDLLRFKGICKAVRPLVAQALNVIDMRDVYDSLAIPQKPIMGLTYRRRLHLQPTDITQHIHIRRQVVLSKKSPLPAFNLSPSETMYTSPRQYFYPERVDPSPTNSSYTLQIRTFVDAAKVSAVVPQSATVQFKLDLDYTTRTASFRLNLTDGAIRTSHNEESRNESALVQLCYHVRRDLESCIQANPRFRDILEPKKGLIATAIGLPRAVAAAGLRRWGVLGPVGEKKPLTEEEKWEMLDEWVGRQKKGEVVVAYKVEVLEVVVPTHCLFGGFVAGKKD